MPLRAARVQRDFVNRVAARASKPCPSGASTGPPTVSTSDTDPSAQDDGHKPHTPPPLPSIQQDHRLTAKIPCQTVGIPWIPWGGRTFFCTRKSKFLSVLLGVGEFVPETEQPQVPGPTESLRAALCRRGYLKPTALPENQNIRPRGRGRAGSPLPAGRAVYARQIPDGRWLPRPRR